MTIKKYTDVNVLDAAKKRIEYTFDNFEKVMLSFSGGKDSSVMFHLTMEEAIKRNQKVGIMIVDLEAQYTHTIEHIEEMIEMYKEYIDLHWICLPIKLRNAVSNFEPCWTCWDAEKSGDWVRHIPKNDGVVSDVNQYPFFEHNMEFEEFIVLFADWYSEGKSLGVLVGIRTDESLNRFRTIAQSDKEMHNNKRFTTKVAGTESSYNVYPIYDWKTSDIWLYHKKFEGKPHNKIYDLMHKAGVKPSQQRLCQPYGDDQRRGLYLYHLLEADTWYKLIARVNGVNSGSLYIQENGNMTGYNKINKPEGHTYQSFAELILATLPKPTQEHYIPKFKTFMKWWAKRGYPEGIPDEAPIDLENKKLAPSWRRVCKVLLRNDWWCKGIGFSQPQSDAYREYLKRKKLKVVDSDNTNKQGIENEKRS